MEHSLELAFHGNAFGHVVFDECEIAAIKQMGDVIQASRQQIVVDNDLVPFCKEPVAEMRSDETGTACEQNTHVSLLACISTTGLGFPIESDGLPVSSYLLTDSCGLINDP